VGARCMAGLSLQAQGVHEKRVPSYYSVKEAVLPFAKFPNVDTLLGPEMRSTGEVMGVGRSFGEAFAKALLAVGDTLPLAGRAFISVRDKDKAACVALARRLSEMGIVLVATRGTAIALHNAGIDCAIVNKVAEGRPHIVDMLKNDDIQLIVNTTEGKAAIADSYEIRRSALHHKVLYATTLAGARAMVMAMEEGTVDSVSRLQDLHREATA